MTKMTLIHAYINSSVNESVPAWTCI